MARAGFVLLPVVVFGVPLAAALIDLATTRRAGAHPVGYYVNQFALDHPIFAAGLAAMIGALIAHYFLNLGDL